MRTALETRMWFWLRSTRSVASRWSEKEAAGEFLDYRLYAMFYWDPVIHQSEPGHEWEEKLRRSLEPFGGQMHTADTQASMTGFWRNSHHFWPASKRHWRRPECTFERLDDDGAVPSDRESHESI